MCGIVGYVGAQQAAPILLEGLQKLEYRGYDSAGIAVLDGSTIELAKACGEIKNLLAKTHDGSDLHGYIGLGHTRWATHGAPTEANAHPHVSNDGKFAIVQNGIIENFMELREMLEAKGFVYMDTPGYDPVSATGTVGAGASSSCTRRARPASARRCPGAAAPAPCAPTVTRRPPRRRPA